MAFLQGKRYMFNMVVLIYIFLHSSKYSINTVNKPSHNVSLLSASGIFRGHLIAVRLSVGHPEWPGQKENKGNLTSTLLNLQRQDKETQHVKYEAI